ncbi:hypothetical protein TWF106_007421 [Orbilia oligospora]|uniref:Uncharacterized protein n=1 Tax=Orbilia oligospora TaxID=2813651 RepID=A0A6G1MCT5_ORBOL|nr:hypothetical protein TWF679_005322 [Orbilia oligospora]KAF3228389.1 hypothetical protein TWF106_007421 [Orbilia oligospora]KAF3228534.1 hypothetical protein TWF191_002390 [Orbilia oligospora]KAF3252959.1 hypothetical protein TWF192_004244 [Orbilia oligospora]
MDDHKPPTTPPKKSIKSYITTLSRKVSQKTVTGAQHLGTLARSATTASRRSKTSKTSDRKYSTTTTTTMKSVTSVFIPSSDINGINNNNNGGGNNGGPPAPRLPNVVYRSPDADFIESHMEARIRSIGANNNNNDNNGDGGENKEEDGDGKEEKEGKKEDRMGGYTIRIINPNCNNEA